MGTELEPRKYFTFQTGEHPTYSKNDYKISDHMQEVHATDMLENSNGNGKWRSCYIEFTDRLCIPRKFNMQKIARNWQELFLKILYTAVYAAELPLASLRTKSNHP